MSKEIQNKELPIPPLMVYKNHKNEDVLIPKLEDRELVVLYKWFQKYHSIIAKINTEDKDYNKYITQMYSIKDGLKKEITKRKLKLNGYKT